MVEKVHHNREDTMEWTEERTQTLTQLWEIGVGVREIAARMGGFEQYKRNGCNAIIGKAHRLNLESREAAACRAAQSRETTARSAKHEPALPCLSLYGASQKRVYKKTRQRNKKSTSPRTPPVKTETVELPTQANQVTVFALSDKTCKWPIGNPGEKDFHFCGNMPRYKSPYCEYHSRAAYQSLSERRQEAQTHAVRQRIFRKSLA